MSDSNQYYLQNSQPKGYGQSNTSRDRPMKNTPVAGIISDRISRDTPEGIPKLPMSRSSKEFGHGKDGSPGDENYEDLNMKMSMPNKYQNKNKSSKNIAHENSIDIPKNPRDPKRRSPLNAPKKIASKPTYHNPNPNASKIAMHKETLRKIRNASLTPPHRKPGLNTSGVEAQARDTSCGLSGGQYANDRIEKCANNLASDRIRKQISKDGTNFYSKNQKLNSLKEPSFDEKYNTKRAIHQRVKSRSSNYSGENYAYEATKDFPPPKPGQLPESYNFGKNTSGSNTENFNNTDYYGKDGDPYDSDEESMEITWNQNTVDDTANLKNQILEKKRRSRNVRNNNEKGGISNKKY